MIKSYKKITSFAVYIILAVLLCSNLFIFYGLIKYFFKFNTSILIHSLFLLSGLFFLFLTTGFIYEISEDEWITYKIGDGIISIEKLFFKKFTLKIDDIKYFYNYKIKNGGNHKLFYSIEDKEGNSINFGNSIIHVEEFIEEIKKYCGEPEEKTFPEEKTIDRLYFYNSVEDNKNIHGEGLKIYNVFNIIIFLFLLFMSFIFEYKINVISEEKKSLLMSVEVMFIFFIVISLVNIIFYYINKNKNILFLNKIIIIGINVFEIIFFITIGIKMVLYYETLANMISNAYMVILIGIIISFLSMANIKTIQWSINKSNTTS